MTAHDLPAPVAARLRRPTWRDPRLVGGVLLVAASVGLGSWVVTTAGSTIGVYAVASTLTPGDEITAQDLLVVDVSLGTDLELYYPASEQVPADLVALRSVGERELLARSAVGSADRLEYRSVAVPVTGALSSKVVAGSTVDLWLVPEDETARASTTADAATTSGAGPALLADSLVVAELAERGSGLMAGGSPTLHVLVPVDALPAVLDALAGTGTVAIVPVPGAAPEASS